MSRPPTKESLLQQAEDNFNKLLNLIDSLSPEQQTGNFPLREETGKFAIV
ncbi:hypothetical protein MASR2M36_38670 [Providencia sp.]